MRVSHAIESAPLTYQCCLCEDRQYKSVPNLRLHQERTHSKQFAELIQRQHTSALTPQEVQFVQQYQEACSKKKPRLVYIDVEAASKTPSVVEVKRELEPVDEDKACEHAFETFINT